MPNQPGPRNRAPSPTGAWVNDRYIPPGGYLPGGATTMVIEAGYMIPAYQRRQGEDPVVWLNATVPVGSTWEYISEDLSSLFSAYMRSPLRVGGGSPPTG